MILFPQAKINLGLHVLSKREDGYHEIDSCMVAVPFTDIVEILPSNTFQFVQSGISIPDSQEHNLCVKAYKLLKEDFDLSPVFIHLRKEIPMGAGLGGGSSDASAVLKGLNELFDLGLTVTELESYSARLGSDCPFFIKNGVQLSSGRGDVLTEFDMNLKGLYIKLINPGIHIGTQEAYSNIVINPNQRPIREILKMDKNSWKNSLNNNFESGAFKNHPVLAEIKEKLYAEGAFYASMSGSGSTMFGLYESKPEISFSTQDDNPYLEIIRQFN